MSDPLTDAEEALLAAEGFVPHPTQRGLWVDTTNDRRTVGAAEALYRARKDRAQREGAPS